MKPPVNIVVAEPSPVAVVVVRTTLAALPEELRRGFDEVGAAASRGEIPAPGHRVAIYRRLGAPDALEVAIGTQVATAFADVGAFRCQKTPAGRAATVTHTGDRAGLPTAHNAILEWADEVGVALAGVSWEVYGPDAVEVFHLLDIEPSVIDY